ncbi:MAG TPA: cupin domain-containing protein [Polyangia bacterium]|jgi:putative transcriptional regulator|nr:cupin domain-containing protein [Polyangia bacterium]
MAQVSHLDEADLWEHALAVPAPADRARCELHLRSCAECRAQLASVAAAGALLGYALPPVAPEPALRARLELSLTAGPLWRHIDAVAALFDLDAGASARQLGRLAADDAWKPGPVAGLRVRLARAGAACAGAYTGFLRLEPGGRFPAHEHLGAEVTLVLAGGLRQNDGRELHAGDRCEMPAGTAHDFVALPGEDCIAAVLQHGGLRFGVAL